MAYSAPSAGCDESPSAPPWSGPAASGAAVTTRRPPDPRIPGTFAEEALPWLDAVYRFCLRLTNGDRDAAEDLAQETFLRAHRFWHTYEGGTKVKSSSTTRWWRRSTTCPRSSGR
jgi:hypothetical protein